MSESLDQIIEAIKKGNSSRVGSLLQSNPELLEAKSEKGGNLLHLAAEEQNVASVKVLLQYGIDTTIRDDMGYTPRDVSNFKGEYRYGAYTNVCKRINFEIDKNNALKDKKVTRFYLRYFTQILINLYHQVVLSILQFTRIKKVLTEYKRKFRCLKNRKNA